MPDAHADPLIVAISSRTLFDMEDSHALFEREGLDAYADFQRSHEGDVLGPGVAFPLVRKLLGLNDGAPPEAPRVEVILISRNSADTGLRIFNSIEHHGLSIKRAAFSNGAPPYPYIKPFGSDLFLSAHAEDVRAALAAGVAAATLLPAQAQQHRHDQLRIAFDGDAVIFGDEGERVSREGGLAAFAAYALAWMDFPGRALLVAAVVGLLVVPLQLALIPLLQLHNAIGIGKGYLGVWLAHTSFGMPMAIYLLRNKSRGSGIGFFEAGNFYPDFIVWAVTGKQQNVVFVEPHGISHEGTGHAKVQFHKTIKEIEGRLADPHLRLESAIVTPTDYAAVKDRGWSRKDWADNHVFFMKDMDAQGLPVFIESVMGLIR